ncbi:hypothetical protein EYC80_009720 [Monilinia laxa]|uniref:Uncharacterized protein n=1 Tax=Monilinia laxa TaxID=61186 RepID=A0A5N6JYR2_MONLA|nr:hypothetical protein EYC80_009720 [Monilinia laxa]
MYHRYLIIEENTPHKTVDPSTTPIPNPFRIPQNPTKLFTGIDNISSNNLTLNHQVINLLQLAQTTDLVWSFDKTASEELNSLSRVLAIANI